MYIVLNRLLQARATNAKHTLVEKFGVSVASAPQKARLLLLKPLDPAVAKQMADAVTSFAKTLVDLFPPQVEDFFARHRSFNHLRLQYDPAKAVAVDRLLDRAFWPDEAMRKECAEALGVDPLLAAFFNADLLVLFLEHYLPSPLTEVVDDLAATHAKEYRVSVRHFALLKAFTRTFSTFSPIRMTVIGDEQSTAPFEVAHRNMLELFQLVEAEATEQRPSFITLDIDDERKLTVTRDGECMLLAKSELRTLVTLALLQSKESFSVDEFSDLYFGERKGDTQKRFNTCTTRVPMLKVVPGGKGRPGCAGSSAVFSAESKGERRFSWRFSMSTTATQRRKLWLQSGHNSSKPPQGRTFRRRIVLFCAASSAGTPHHFLTRLESRLMCSPTREPASKY